ncbi:MAG: hypothetical protein JO307_04645 [Bryobacterales bacterium]|nr:hypothetical protein [Bryobacterales bacterium]MBV9397399.1 hypothetical protein [Bryobacterales bacterium]
MRRLVFAFGVMLPALALAQSKAEYVGGTAPQIRIGAEGSIQVDDDRYFAFYSRKAQVRVDYEHINLIEYGQQVSRRIAIAAIISPLFMLSKSRKHFLTIGYMGDDGKQQALVFRVDKNDIRATLVSLEARTGLKVEYQDPEARKAGKG